MKKGSANMWWIIIGAVIALVVMIILMVMFTGKSGALEGELLKCESKGGTCMTVDKCDTAKGTISGVFSCTNELEKCCFAGK
ncbi:hypothetical protein HOI26_01240 [Candidatus Woesearchaeota archaeon]|jgi:hypothetical protein|nr:hypothetical protein [Candidatus Woesearchaeota archaeon]MBT5739699.1 hypothetical protein [Candidatus Woesearchaeota archaeon]